MNNSYVLTIDQSTSGTKAIIFDMKGKIIRIKTKEHKQYYPQSEWVEHDPNEIFKNVIETAKKVIKKSAINKNELKALSVTNQRETIVLWDNRNGKPLYNAIVWQCRRSKNICNKLKKYEKMIKDKTGLVLNSYFSASKIKWLLENNREVEKASKNGYLAIGTIDSWIIWNLTDGKEHVTDYTNASRTMLMNIKKLEWDKELLDIFGVKKEELPKIKGSDELYGYCKKEFLGVELPITGVIGDSQGALVGQKAFKKGDIKATYGTGSSILMNIGEKYLESKNGLCTSLGWVVNNKPTYALEGVIVTSGDTLKWLKEDLKIIDSFDEIEKILSKKTSNDGVYLVPAFAGLGIPYWNSNVRASIMGMTRNTNKETLVRAGVESIAYQIKDCISIMKEESKIDIKEIRVDGGASKNKILMQFQADILQKKLKKSEVAELSAQGSFYLAGVYLGIWKNLEDINQEDNSYKNFSPVMNEVEVEKNIQGWRNAVDILLGKSSI